MLDLRATPLYFQPWAHYYMHNILSQLMGVSSLKTFLILKTHLEIDEKPLKNKNIRILFMSISRKMSQYIFSNIIIENRTFKNSSFNFFFRFTFLFWRIFSMVFRRFLCEFPIFLKTIFSTEIPINMTKRKKVRMQNFLCVIGARTKL